MEKFLKQLGFFIFFFIIGVGGLFLLEKKMLYVDLNPENKILVIGHSHPETAINDSLIYGLVNFASSGEAYNYNLYKTRYPLHHNLQIKTVLIEVTNNSIELEQDLWVAGEEKMTHYLPRRIQFMNWSEIKFLYEINPEAFKESSFPIIRQRIMGIVNGFNYTGKLGGYKPLIQILPDSVPEAPIGKKLGRLTDANISELNLKYLEDLVRLCRQREVDVLFIRSPLHKEYPLYNEDILRGVLSSKFPDIDFLDFSDFPLKNKSFADLEHLNCHGAAIFSNWLNEQIGSGLLERADREVLVKKNIKELTKIKR